MNRLIAMTAALAILGTPALAQGQGSTSSGLLPSIEQQVLRLVPGADLSNLTLSQKIALEQMNLGSSGLRNDANKRSFIKATLRKR